MREIEILAPAGSEESIYASLAMGADAVYVGTSRFGARAFADNPTSEEIQEALVYAHLRGKKIYLTVNTLLSDRELEEELYPLICPLYEAGLDACIVQDIGVMAFLHENFPDMPLHASTQMTLFSGREAELFRQYGITRYVPARELTIQEIREARAQTELEIEVFVHGALCYCYSGQCLMSEVIGGRSGNRGMCAQPCRLPWKCAGREGYFLSTKDICTLMYIPELVEAGIDSFKIEGRMKKKEYSAYLSYIYRRYTDFYLREGREAFERLREDRQSGLWRDYRRAGDIYNRGGFSDSYLFEKDKRNMIFPVKNGHCGMPVGEVTGAGRGTADFVTSRDIHYQDVLEFRGEDGEKLYEYTVKNPAAAGEQVTARVGKESRIRPGQEVFRTKNAALLQWVREEIKKRDKPYPLTGSFQGRIGRGTKLTVSGNGCTVTIEGPEAARAEKRPVTEEDIRKRLEQTGKSGYYFDELTVEADETLFLPLGSLKELRRSAVREWENKAVSRRKAPGMSPAVFREESEEELRAISVSSVEQLVWASEEAEADCMFHLMLEDIAPDDWERAAGLLRGKRAAVSFPRVLRGSGRKNFEKLWEEKGSALRGLPVEAVFVNSHAMYLYALEFWPDAVRYADENMYLCNSGAGEVGRSFGVRPGPEREYGRTAVMVTEGCVLADCFSCDGKEKQTELVSPRGDKFVVVNHCRYCYNTIYTAEPVRRRTNSAGKRLFFTWEREDEVRKVIREWNF